MAIATAAPDQVPDGRRLIFGQQIGDSDEELVSAVLANVGNNVVHDVAIGFPTISP